MNHPNKNSIPTLSEYMLRKATARGIPLSCGFELTPVCNFECRMCYVRKTKQEVQCSQRGLLSLEQWKEIARNARDAGVLYVLLTGGEPLGWEGFWELYDELVDMGMLVSVNTNGSMIMEETVRRFSHRRPRKVNVTLYGANDDTYRRLCGVDHVFSKVDRGIRGLQAAGINVKINCSLTPDNVPDQEAIAVYAKERNLPLSVTGYMFPPIRRDVSMVGVNQRFTPEEAAACQLRVAQLQSSPARYRDYLRQICEGYAEPPGLEEECIDPVDGKVRCLAGRSSFWITWDGWMTPCGMMPEPKVDIKETDFLPAWKQLLEETGKIRLSGACEKCGNRGICHPCGAIALAETGEYGKIPEYLCRMAREMKRLAQLQLGEE